MNATPTTSRLADPAVRPDRVDVTPENLPDLVTDLKKAHAAALAAHATIDDLTGSCNMDSPVLRVKNVRLGAAAVKIAGGDSYVRTSYGKKDGLVMVFPSGGQAVKRTAFAEAFYKELTARGWSASISYCVD